MLHHEAVSSNRSRNLTWFDVKLRSLAESLGRVVISHDECWQVAEILGLDEA